jgi:hypothetical protein
MDPNLKALEAARISQGIRDYLMTRYGIGGASVVSGFETKDDVTTTNLELAFVDAPFKGIKVTMEFH